MRLASTEFKNQEGGNLLKIELSWADSSHSPMILTYDNLSAFNYQANGTESSSLSLGFASISTFTASLINTTGAWDHVKFKGARALLFIGKDLPGGGEFVKIGHFIIESGVKNEGIIQLTGEDHMALLDVRFKGITFPCTIRDLIDKACVQVGVHFATQSFTNFNKMVDTLENVTQFTCREIVSFACELAGGFAIMNSDGELEVRWFDTNAVPARIAEHHITMCKPEEAITPSGISAYFSGEEFLVGSNESLVYLTEDHVLARNISSSDKELILAEIYDNSIANLRYDAGSVEAKGNCLIEPGDVVQFEHKGNVYKFIVAAIKLSGNLKMTITSTTPTSSSSTSGGGSSISGSRGDSGSLQIAHMLSYDTASLAPAQGAESSVELISVFITQAGNHVPVAMFTTTFTYDNSEDIVEKVKITLRVGQITVHTFEQNCHKGSNMLSFSWPLNDLPQGASKITVAASITNSTGSSVAFTWKPGDTSLIVLGRGFATVSTWNGLLLLSDTFRPLKVISHIGDSLGLRRVNGEVRSDITGFKAGTPSEYFVPMSLSARDTFKDTLFLRSNISETLSTRKEEAN